MYICLPTLNPTGLSARLDYSLRNTDKKTGLGLGNANVVHFFETAKNINKKLLSPSLHPESS